jgi:hypothetical protein
MPFRSKAQRRKFAELLLKGEITNEQFEEWNRETGSKELPERVKPNAKKKSKAAKTGSKKKKAPASNRRKSKAVKKRPAKRKAKAKRRAK